MKLKILKVIISSRKVFIADLRKAIHSGENSEEEDHSISFDSIENFKRLMTANKLEILMAIARLKPASINQLAKLINREYPHVLKDCRSLKVLGFIKLEEVGAARKQLAPMLIFDYDIIHVKSQIEEIFPITEQSNRVLLTAQVG
jgi:predicted transcriptional regulator